MDLRNRLHRMLGARQDGKPNPADASHDPGPTDASHDPGSVDASPNPDPAHSSLDRGPSLPGEAVESEHGTYWKRTCVYPLDHAHGKNRLETLLQGETAHFALASGDPGLHAFAPERAIYLDTETTSLGGGAGVYVFMAGLGFFQEGAFHVEQYFMVDFDCEAAMLHAFNERVSQFTALVSFFGKNFDRYRLEDRMNTLGIRSALPVTCHLDLYHVARRLYKGRFENLKLKTLEKELLGFHREGDIPGAECPEAYFRFLRKEGSEQLVEVFEHNLLDILSLVTLAKEVEQFVASPQAPRDHYVLACLHMKQGCASMDQALLFLEQACPELPSGPDRVDAHLRLARLLKRKKDSARLDQVLDRLLAMAPTNPQVLTENAKFQEHQRRDYARALDLARCAQVQLKLLLRIGAAPERLLREAERRIERLHKKTETL